MIRHARRCRGGAFSCAAVFALGIACAVARPATCIADEVGLDAGQSVRQRLHEDTGGFDTRIEIDNVEVSGELTEPSAWQLRLQHTWQDWRLVRRDDTALFDVRALRTRARGRWESSWGGVDGSVESVRLSEQPARYTPRADSEEQFSLPSLSVHARLDAFTVRAGGWRELDLITSPSLEYTAAVMQAEFVQLEATVRADHVVWGRLGTMERIRPSSFPLKRNEDEIGYRLDDPLGAGPGALWRMLEFRYVAWDFTAESADGRDSWFAIVDNVVRFSWLGVEHILTDRLTFTNVYTVYRSAADPDAILELDRSGSDVQHRIEYTAYDRISSTALFWRIKLRADDSLRRDASRERYVQLGVSYTF